MKHPCRVFALVLLACLGGCASVPQESVTLSSEVGAGIARQHQAQVRFLNLYFEAKREDIDAAFQQNLATYFSTIAPAGSITLTRAQLGDVATDVMDKAQKAMQAKEALEKVRIYLLDKLNENYLTLSQANATVTGLLNSIVATKQATHESIQLISTATDGRVNLSEVFAKIDTFVAKGGYEAGRAIDLVDQVKTLTK